MGSVQSHIECPNCKSEDCLNDYYYRTGEEHDSCPDCGYYRSIYFKRDEEGKLIRKDESKGFSNENLILIEEGCHNPYAAYSVSCTGGAGAFGTLESKESYDGFVSEIESLMNQEHNFEKVTISRFVNGKIEVEEIPVIKNEVQD